MGLTMLVSRSWAGLAPENILRQIFPPQHCLSVLAKNSLLTFVFYWSSQIMVTEFQEM
jgi:hypothetical protein